MTSEQMRAARAQGKSQSDWSRVRRAVAQGAEPVQDDDAPDATSAMRAALKSRGRPKSAEPKQLLTLRVAPSVIDRWKATGPGWQTRMAEVLAKAL